MQSLDDGTHELAVLTDVTQGGSSLQDGALEFMVHRRIQDDDSRGVQEPLNETMCGCGDIGAAPGAMGAHGHEGDGGCACAGLTMRGRHLLLFDTVESVHAQRRALSEELNFPALLGFSAAPLAQPPLSSVGAALPENVKLVTLTSNYAGHNQGQVLLRLSHLYSAGEHPTLAQPADVDLSSIFSKQGLTITAATETTLTGNRPLAEVDAAKHAWPTHAPNAEVAAHVAEVAGRSFETRTPFDFPHVTIRPMEVRTFSATIG